ncbi:hypothetical protein Tco_1166780, partial [Tanacetum coccineum]
MQLIAEEFMRFSSEVTRRIKERIKENKNKSKKIEKIIKYPDTKVLENSAKHDILENLKKKAFPTPANLLCVRYVRLIHSNPSQPLRNIFGFNPGERANMSRHNPSNSLTVQSPTQNDPTFMVNDPIKCDPSPHRSFSHAMSKRAKSTRGQASSSREEIRYNPLHKVVTFRLGGVEREISLLKLGWRVGLYSKSHCTQILPQNVLPIFKNTNVIAPRMYKVHTKPNQTRTPRLPLYIRKTNKRVSFSTGVIPNTSVSRPQLKSNQLEDKVMSNNSQGKKKEVEDHRRNFKFSNNKTYVTACNDSLNAKTSNVNFVCVTCGKYVLNDNHDLCVLHYINGVSSRTRQPIAVPISTRETKHNVNQSVATS